MTTRLEFVLTYPGILCVDPQSVDQQCSDVRGKQLSTFNITLNLILIFLAKVRIKEPASKSLNNTTAVNCRQYKRLYNNKIIESYQLREGTEASGRSRLHERMAMSRREASIRPPHARRFRVHLGNDSVRSKLPPLCVPVSPSPVSREASRDLWRSIGPSIIVVFKLQPSL